MDDNPATSPRTASVDSAVEFQELMHSVLRGDELAAFELFDRCYCTLQRSLRARMDRRVQTRFDEEDVLQSVFRSFFARCRGGLLVINGWESLWGVLVVLSRRKLGRRLVHEQAQRRNCLRDQPLDGFVDQAGCSHSKCEDASEYVAVKEVLQLVEAQLDLRDREILRLHLACYSSSEIGQRIPCATRTVRRVLLKIRTLTHNMLLNEP